MHKTSLQILYLIAIVTIINYFDRSAMSYAILSLQRDLGLNDLQFGAIASAFGIGYLSVVVFAGMLVDRFGSIKIWVLSAILWSFVTMAMGSAQGFLSLFCLRLLLGMTEAVHFPALLKTIADWLDIRYRGRALSFSLLGVPFSSVIGAPFLSFLIETISWRGMFYLLGIFGLLWSIIWLRFFQKKKNPHLSASTTKANEKKFAHWKDILSTKPLLISCIVYFVFGYIIFFGLTWIPGFLEMQHDISIGKTGLLLTLPWLASCLLLLLGGWISDALMKKTESMRIARSLPIGIGLLLSSASFYLLLHTNQLELQILLLSLGFGFAFSINSPIYALNADLFPAHTGTAQGIMSGFFALAAVVAPALTGWLVESSQQFHSSIFFIFIFTLSGSLLTLFLQHPKHPSE